MARELDARNARWLECPLYPEEIEAHARLAAAIRTCSTPRTPSSARPSSAKARITNSLMLQASASNGTSGLRR